MKNRIAFLMLTCILSAWSALTLQAQTDVTNSYLNNAGFDTNFDYTVSDQGNVAQEILDVEGWTKDIDADYTITGVYQYGTAKTFNNVGVPSTGYNDASGGGLALSTGWGVGLKFYQEVTLAEGRYAIVTAFYNSSTVTAGSSLVGWLPADGADVMSSLSAFPSSRWVADTLYFSVPAETTGKIQIGLQSVEGVGSGSTAKVLLDFAQLLSYGIDKTDLNAKIDEAAALYDASANGAAALDAAIATATTVQNNTGATMAEIVQAIEALDAAILVYRYANPTGAVPVVVTNPDHVRGATMAFGRSTISGVSTSQLAEHGFCWSTDPEPTIFDHKTTSYFSNNGYLYRIEDLQPATVYYMRAYAVSQDYAVGYGDVIKVITIPRGTVTYTIRDNATGENGDRITAAVSTAVDYWNNLTSIQGQNISAGYSSGVPTAEASYGGWMTFGSNTSYQQTGTALHEMNHTIGVGQHRIWYGPNSPLRAGGTTGNWLGERANKVVRFLDNNPSSVMTGDATHMWPYGINGAHEDTGSELLYIGNSLITQALGEDGLPPTGGFTTPAYTFESDENTKYYIKNEDEGRGLITSYLVEDAAGRLVWKAQLASQALDNDSAAWYFEFNPANCYYHIRNASTGKYFSYVGTGTNGVGLQSIANPTSTENFQLMGARVNTTVGTGNDAFTAKGYWIVYPQRALNPPCFAAATNGATSVTTFDLTNSATTQRWMLLTSDEIMAFESTTDNIILSDLKVNGSTVSGFSSDTVTYTYYVAPDAEASSWVVSAEKGMKYEGTLVITQASTIPGEALVEAIGAGGVDKTYRIQFVKNYAYGWDGNGATGTGTEPTSFGWSSTPTVSWTVANGGSANRYMEPGTGEYASYTFDGADYKDNRILWIRYNQSEEFMYSFEGLQSGMNYKLSLKYGWHNNGVAPNITVGIYEKTDGALLSESVFASSSTKRVLRTGEINFAVPAIPASDTYYISFKNNANSDCMVIIADLVVVDGEETESLQEADIEDQSLQIITCEHGIRVSCAEVLPSGGLTIYSVTGQVIRSISLPADQLFVPLPAGMYIIGNQKVVVQ